MCIMEAKCHVCPDRQKKKAKAVINDAVDYKEVLAMAAA